MCSTPDVPTMPERQAVKLPDSGAPQGAANNNTRRRALIAGLMTSPQGILAPAATGKPTLG